MKFTESQTLMLYLSVWIITLLLVYVTEYFRKKKVLVIRNGHYRWNTFKFRENILFACVPLGMSILFAARDLSIGTDTYNYYHKYNTIDSVGLFDNEPLYYLLNKGCSLLGMTFNQFQFIVCLFTSFFVVKGIYFYLKNSTKNVLLSIFLYYIIYFFLSMNMTRQMIAVAIVFYGTKYLVNRKYLRYLMICIIATGFHFAAIITLIFYIASVIENSNDKYRRYWYYVVIIIATIFGAPFLSIVGQIVKLNYSVSARFGLGFMLNYVIPLVLIVLYELHFMVEDSEDVGFRILKNVFLLTIPLRTLGYGAEAMMRLAHYSAIFQIVLIPMFLSRIKNDSIRRLLYFVTIVIYIFLLIYDYLSVNEIFPYSTGNW